VKLQANQILTLSVFSSVDQTVTFGRKTSFSVVRLLDETAGAMSFAVGVLLALI